MSAMAETWVPALVGVVGDLMAEGLAAEHMRSSSRPILLGKRDDRHGMAEIMQQPKQMQTFIVEILQRQNAAAAAQIADEDPHHEPGSIGFVAPRGEQLAAILGHWLGRAQDTLDGLKTEAANRMGCRETRFQGIRLPKYPGTQQWISYE